VPAPAFSLEGEEYEPHVAAEESAVLVPGNVSRSGFDQYSLGANRRCASTLSVDFSLSSWIVKQYLDKSKSLFKGGSSWDF
jgi:hypothetical protein